MPSRSDDGNLTSCRKLEHYNQSYRIYHNTTPNPDGEQPRRALSCPQEGG